MADLVPQAFRDEESMAGVKEIFFSQKSTHNNHGATVGHFRGISVI